MKKVFMISLLLLVGISVLAISLVDDLGRLVILDETPNKVIVAAPGITKYLEVLSLDSKIIGVTDWDSYGINHDVEKIGNLVPLNLEKILSLEPDLVFLMAGFQETEVKRLDEMGINAFVVNPGSFEEIARAINLIGNIFDQGDMSKKIAAEFREMVIEIAKKSYSIAQENKPKVLYAMATAEMNEIWTTGTGSYLNQAIAYAGGLNVAAPYTGNNGFLPVSPEFVLKTFPDIIVVPYYYEGGQEAAVKMIMEYEPFSEIPAVKNNKVYAISNTLTDYADPNYSKLIETFHEFFYGE